MLQAAIFDMDGLMIDSEPFWRRAEMEVFGDAGVSLSYEECGQTIGLRIDEVVTYWYARRPWTGVAHEEIEKRIVFRVRELVEEQGTAKAGLYEVLSFFRERSIPLALASSSSRFLIDAVLRRLQLESYFQVTHSAEGEKRGKPAPDVYCSTCALLGFSPAETLAFEDSPNGIRSAKSAGLLCVGVPEETLPADVEASCDLVLRSLEQFAEAEWAALVEKSKK